MNINICSFDIFSSKSKEKHSVKKFIKFEVIINVLRDLKIHLKKSLELVLESLLMFN